MSSCKQRRTTIYDNGSLIQKTSVEFHWGHPKWRRQIHNYAVRKIHWQILTDNSLYFETHTHHRFTASFPEPPGWAAVPCRRRNLLLNFMVQGKITETDTSTIRLGATPSGLISHAPPSSPIFTPDALLAANLPTYPGLGQAPNMLACIPSRLVHYISKKISYHNITERRRDMLC